MAERPDKRARRERLRQWRGAERASARARLPLADDQFRALFDHLSTEFPVQGCNHTLRLTRAWLVVNGIPEEPVISWLNEHGGRCDCEALANSEQAWAEANRGVD